MTPDPPDPISDPSSGDASAHQVIVKRLLGCRTNLSRVEATCRAQSRVQRALNAWSVVTNEIPVVEKVGDASGSGLASQSR